VDFIIIGHQETPQRMTYQLRMVNGKVFNADKSVLFESVSGEVIAE